MSRIIEAPDEICGIYHLMLGDKVRYVGQTINIFTRIGGWKIPRFKARMFDRVEFFPCAVEDLNRLELEHIRRYQPEFNSDGVHKPYKTRKLPIRMLSDHNQLLRERWELEGQIHRLRARLSSIDAA